MRIVIVNAHSCCNLGDAAILLTMVESLAQEFSGAEFVVVSDTPEKDAAFYGAFPVIGISYPWQERSGMAALASKSLFHSRFWLALAASRLCGSPLGLVPGDAARVLASLREADLVVNCGGGYLNSLGKLFARLSLALAGVVFSKPVIWYSQSVSDLASGWDRYLVKTTLNLSSLFIARESITFQYLKQLGVRQDKLRLQADSAFLLKQLPPAQYRTSLPAPLPGEERVGMTVTRWGFPGCRNSHEKTENYVQSLRRFVGFLTGELGVTVVVFPQVTGPSPYSDDRTFGDEIFGPLNNERIILLKDQYQPGQLKSLIGTMSAFVGTRMHSNIFALGARVPTLAIAYQDKTTGIMNMLGLGGHVLSINDLSFDALKDSFYSLWQERSILREQLRRALPEVERSAHQASRLCRDLYRDGGGR